jgi:ABC-type uncharacterized transport system substrate-binding protein
MPVDVIIAASGPAAGAAKGASATIPIVAVASGDPLAGGLVSSLARPDANLTGLGLLSSELSVKRLHLLTEVVPGITRVAALADAGGRQVESGGLVGYGPSFAGSFYRAAYYVDRLLKGAKPADLPIELPTTFELVLNLKAARALGIGFPPEIFRQATEVLQ